MRANLINKNRAKTVGLVFKPIITKTFNTQTQMDLIDFQSLLDGDCKWLMLFKRNNT
jgi:hypothetical protein